jgi:anaerobic selenocysteine-containing dehydrogenase
MLLEPADTVVLLPAQTRYEQRGGGTETSTERRIIFSPEIPGPRVGEARCEWEIFTELAARVRPDHRERITFACAEDIRRDISRAMPGYKGIEGLSKKGDQVQYGGRYLYADGIFETADKMGHFTALTPPELQLSPGKFMLSTRRGKQFNSMIYASKDAITGVGRDALLISQQDATSLGLSDKDRVLVKSDNGATMEFQIHIDRIQPRNVQAFWPECNLLIRRRVYDVAAGVPDFNAIVEIAPVKVASPAQVAALPP